mmetsp:Transcript_20605/g.79093  ORF Transcript_20605/g.79093 Transcript_20605/m.79093 type:complete len:239 (-) Transcript_20605:179-895(-)
MVNRLPETAPVACLIMACSSSISLRCSRSRDSSRSRFARSRASTARRSRCSGPSRGSGRRLPSATLEGRSGIASSRCKNNVSASVGLPGRWAPNGAPVPSSGERSSPCTSAPGAPPWLTDAGGACAGNTDLRSGRLREGEPALEPLAPCAAGRVDTAPRAAASISSGAGSASQVHEPKQSGASAGAGGAAAACSLVAMPSPPLPAATCASGAAVARATASKSCSTARPTAKGTTLASR